MKLRFAWITGFILLLAQSLNAQESQSSSCASKAADALEFCLTTGALHESPVKTMGEADFLTCLYKTLRVTPASAGCDSYFDQTIADLSPATLDTGYYLAVTAGQNSARQGAMMRFPQWRSHQVMLRNYLKKQEDARRKRRSK